MPGEAVDDGFAPIVPWSDEMFREVRRLTYRYRARAPWYIEADDLNQEVHLQIAVRVNRHRTVLTRRYLAGLVRHTCRDYERKHRRLKTMKSIDYAPEGAVRANLPYLDARHDVRRAIESLTPACKAVVEGRFFEYRSFGELAAAWGRAEITARDRIKPAFSQLRAQLAGGYGPSELRIRETPRKTWRAYGAGRKVNWSLWGPLPNQRKDD